MLLPSIHQLKGKSSISFIGRMPALDLLRPHIHLAGDVEGREWRRLYLDGPERPPRVPKPDFAVLFTGDVNGVIQKNLKTFYPAADIHSFPPLPPEDSDIHAALYMARCLRQSGLPIDPEKAMHDAVNRPLLAEGISVSKQGGIVCHPGSGGLEKNYPPELWLQIVEDLIEEYPNEELTLLIGPAETAISPFFTKHLRKKNCRILCSPKIEDLLVLLKKAVFYVGHDSGITHMAAMSGCPTVALFKKSSISQWAPLGPCVRILDHVKPGARSLIGHPNAHP